MCRADKKTLWEFSSAGRASALQAEGHRFEPVPGRQLFSEKLDMLVWLNGRAADL